MYQLKPSLAPPLRPFISPRCISVSASKKWTAFGHNDLPPLTFWASMIQKVTYIQGRKTWRPDGISGRGSW